VDVEAGVTAPAKVMLSLSLRIQPTSSCPRFAGALAEPLKLPATLEFGTDLGVRVIPVAHRQRAVALTMGRDSNLVLARFCADLRAPELRIGALGRADLSACEQLAIVAPWPVQVVRDDLLEPFAVVTGDHGPHLTAAADGSGSRGKSRSQWGSVSCAAVRLDFGSGPRAPAMPWSVRFPGGYA
jgi:hypothetical protein